MSKNSLSFHKKTKNSFLKELVEWIITFVITILVSLFIFGNVFSLTQIDGQSMEPTLLHGDRVINYKLGYNFTEPKQGEIIILNKIEGKKGLITNTIEEAKDIISNIFNKITKEEKEKVKYIVKRVIGVPGDVIDIKDGNVYLNAKKIEEGYIKGKTIENSDFLYPLIVPENKVFVLGDNRENSLDSRQIGLIDYDQVKGNVKIRLFPFKRIGKVD